MCTLGWETNQDIVQVKGAAYVWLGKLKVGCNPYPRATQNKGVGPLCSRTAEDRERCWKVKKLHYQAKTTLSEVTKADGGANRINRVDTRARGPTGTSGDQKSRKQALKKAEGAFCGLGVIVPVAVVMKSLPMVTFFEILKSSKETDETGRSYWEWRRRCF
ncbi:hypothetical protein AMTR_s00001p00132240 [Amborella trichopoda]|uniref:Uncharacterized protein n=1 Tax=Amborella trichopoda TaxID=13333 RepID=W1NLY1_AMBTC|nr:hypothetical protein AMTR_s00001p00132240 [Amborella trichopoda]